MLKVCTLSSFSGSHKGAVALLEVSGSLALALVVLPLSEITASPWDVVKCIPATTPVDQTTQWSLPALTLQECPHCSCSGSGQWQSEQPGQPSCVSRTLPYDHSITAGANTGKLGKLLFFGSFYKHLSSLFAPAQQLDPVKQYLGWAVPQSQCTKVTESSVSHLHNFCALQESVGVLSEYDSNNNFAIKCSIWGHLHQCDTGSNSLSSACCSRSQRPVLEAPSAQAVCREEQQHFTLAMLPQENGSTGGWWVNPCKYVYEKSCIWGFYAEKSLIFLCYTESNPSFKSLALLTCNTEIPADAVVPDKWWQRLDCLHICSPEEAPVLQSTLSLRKRESLCSFYKANLPFLIKSIDYLQQYNKWNLK